MRRRFKFLFVLSSSRHCLHEKVAVWRVHVSSVDDTV